MKTPRIKRWCRFRLIRLRRKKKLLSLGAIVVISLVVLTLASRICVAYFLATDAAGDGFVYSRLAKNLLEQRVFSVDEQAPFTPTLIRMPSYPLFMAGVYYLFGNDNNMAVRIVEAEFDTATCVIIGLLAWFWTEDEERKRRNALWAFLLAAVCPFIVIYSAMIMTETLTTFLMVTMALTATFALRAVSAKKSLLYWIFTGLLAGAAVFLRPDSGLFAAGIGSMLVISGLFLRSEDSPKFSVKVLQVGSRGAVFSLAFALVLAPWAVRNYRVFGLFQPLSPAHGEMPDEFYPLGYDRWLRTWVDDFRFIEPTLWNLDLKPIDINKIPANNFDSPEERARVALLLDQYNHPPGSENRNPPPKEEADDNSPDETDSEDDNNGDSSDNNSDSGDKNERSPEDN